MNMTFADRIWHFQKDFFGEGQNGKQLSFGELLVSCLQPTAEVSENDNEWICSLLPRLPECRPVSWLQRVLR